jgi:hypothetical protein
MKLRIAFCALLVAPLVSGCGVKSSVNFTGTLSPSLPNGPMAMKVSPGQVTATSSDISMQAGVTPTKKPFVGGGFSAQLSISRSPVSP